MPACVRVGGRPAARRERLDRPYALRVRCWACVAGLGYVALEKTKGQARPVGVSFAVCVASLLSVRLVVSGWLALLILFFSATRNKGVFFRLSVRSFVRNVKVSSFSGANKNC